jgi:Domain of unknown function (DUF222)
VHYSRRAEQLSPDPNSSTGWAWWGLAWWLSVAAPVIEYVFEGCGDAKLLELMGEAQQAERAAFARQLMAVGRLAQRRIEQMSGEHDFWCVDDWEAIAAEIGAELGISRGRAGSQMRYGIAVR